MTRRPSREAIEFAIVGGLVIVALVAGVVGWRAQASQFLTVAMPP